MQFRSYFDHFFLGFYRAGFGRKCIQEVGFGRYWSAFFWKMAWLVGTPLAVWLQHGPRCGAETPLAPCAGGAERSRRRRPPQAADGAGWLRPPAEGGPPRSPGPRLGTGPGDAASLAWGETCPSERLTDMPAICPGIVLQHIVRFFKLWKSWSWEKLI